MPISTSQILDVLREYDINPLEDDIADIDLPGIGEIEEDKSVYATSIVEVFGRGDDGESAVLDGLGFDDPRMKEWHERLGASIDISNRSGWPNDGLMGRVLGRAAEQPEPHSLGIARSTSSGMLGASSSARAVSCRTPST